MIHQPVLLKEVIKFLDPKPGDFIIDGTIDGGGHAGAILERIGPKGKFLGLDWDEGMISDCQKRFLKYENAILAQGNYAELPQILKKKKLSRADGLLLDLGFSSEQIENSGRGFSFLKDEPLLMTYNEDRKPVKQLLKELSAEELAKIIFDLSGEKFAMRIAQAVKGREKIKPIETTKDLQEIIENAVPKNYERGRINSATRTFQALRICANDELGNLEKILQHIGQVIQSGGRAVFISFHSLEDRLVKNYFREMAKQNILEILTKKPVISHEEEIAINPRSRSAKLRVAKII